MDLNGKCVLLGVSGGIAAYKMANVASALRKLGADVEVIMTKNATQFITPLTFETLTGHKCMVDTFDRDFKFEVTHISLAKKADVILVAPATANVIAKMAHGIADDMLTTVVLAAKCPKLVSPAMNTGMLENPITQDNLATLERYGFTVIPSESGVLACKDVGSGRLPKEEVLLEYILHTIARPKDLAGLRIAVTAGPTQEALDPVRYLTNHSTGKMGYALARAACALLYSCRSITVRLNSMFCTVSEDWSSISSLSSGIPLYCKYSYIARASLISSPGPFPPESTRTVFGYSSEYSIARSRRCFRELLILAPRTRAPSTIT